MVEISGPFATAADDVVVTGAGVEEETGSATEAVAGEETTGAGIGIAADAGVVVAAGKDGTGAWTGVLSVLREVGAGRVVATDGATLAGACGVTVTG